MSADYTPLEAGLERFVRLDKCDFIGRDALLRQQERGVERQLACLVVDADGADAHSYEPVFDGDRALGYVSAGGYGHFLEQSIAFAYLPSEYAKPGTELTIEIIGESRPSTVVAQPLYDPRNERLLS